ncbi:alpha/beta hydrolase [Streptomyces sp. NPDC052101]|uniref:alpha/beta hydrolase n=1 Tax=Streptomyces sp. NPDC052101 TaxID=3155763 RepID=UPI0034347CF1
MRLVFVHGRGQGESSSEKLRDKWLEALEAGCRSAGVSLADPLDLGVPFYGRALDEATAEVPVKAIIRGSDEAPDPVEEELLLELAARAEITDEEISEELAEPVVARKPENWRWVLAAGRLLSRRFPSLGEDFIRRFTADVHAYLHWPHARNPVNKLFIDECGDGPTVVVSHSLGTIVAYWALAEHKAPPPVPLFVTLGSPLGIEAIKRRLPRPVGKPSCVKIWLNAADVRDPVALFARLDRDTFPAQIENLSDVHNPKDNPHAITGYLADCTVAARIMGAL